MQFITYRLADALPADVLERLREQSSLGGSPADEVNHLLDSGLGSCALRDPRHASAVLETWLTRHEIDYRLHAWVVMPNHVHLVVEPLAGHCISRIVGTWKSVSARRICTGPAAAEGGRAPSSRRFWQPDYFDRYLRDSDHLRRAVAYIHANPVTAKLVAAPEDWTWSSARSPGAG